MPALAATWKTTSQTPTARATASASATSPRTCSTPSAARAGYSPRERLRTESPRARSCAAIALPRNPPPPVTRAFIGSSSPCGPDGQLLAKDLGVVADVDRERRVEQHRRDL